MTKNIRNLALATMSGFRHKTVDVPEWEGATVVLREPSAEAGCAGRRSLKQKMMRHRYPLRSAPAEIWRQMLNCSLMFCVIPDCNLYFQRMIVNR